jgi:tetratricopeptide (TPR) repeat protein
MNPLLTQIKRVGLMAGFILLGVAAADAKSYSGWVRYRVPRSGAEVRFQEGGDEAVREAKQELNEAAKSYKQGQYAAAEQHSRRALQLDPNSRIAPSFIARSIHAQYRPGVSDAENIAIAERAIDAYQEILHRDPRNQEPFRAIVALLNSLHHEDELRAFVSARLQRGDLPDPLRIEGNVLLAKLDWQRVFAFTEQPNIKKVLRNGTTRFVYPPNGAAECGGMINTAFRGLDEVEQALLVEPDNESAWFYKTNLLIVMARFAEMNGDVDQRADYIRQAVAARQRAGEFQPQ